MILKLTQRKYFINTCEHNVKSMNDWTFGCCPAIGNRKYIKLLGFVETFRYPI